MTTDEFKAILATLASYFPTMTAALTPEQAAQWRKGLDGIPVNRVQDAIARQYRADGATWPTIARIAAMARPEVVTKKPRYEGPFLPAEVNKAEARRGLELLAQRRAQRQEASTK